MKEKRPFFNAMAQSDTPKRQSSVPRFSPSHSQKLHQSLKVSSSLEILDSADLYTLNNH
jgi:hypothetical protein